VSVRLLDLHHLGNPGVIAVYLLETPEPALVDCGPAVCADRLTGALGELGLALTDIRHVLLTHVHPDHGGAAGALVRAHPRLLVHVSEIGAPHLVDPARLQASARRLYREDFGRVFGPIQPVPSGNVRVLGDRVLGLDVVATPGHAPHHVCFLDGDGACYTGDTAGCLIPPGRFLYPASAPPQVDLGDWEASLAAIERRRPSVLRLTHFGGVDDPCAHLARLRERLHAWFGRVSDGQSVAEFVANAEAELQREAGETAQLYRQLPGFELSYAGLRRYLDERSEQEE